MLRIYQTIFIFLSLFLWGCTSISGHRYINIDPPEFGSELVPDQVNSFLVDNGFKRISLSARVRDYNAGATDALNMKTGSVLDSHKNLLMRYQHEITTILLVNVTIGKDKGNIKLEFYEADNTQFSPESIDIYNQFKENLKVKLYDEKGFKASQ